MPARSRSRFPPVKGGLAANVWVRLWVSVKWPRVRTSAALQALPPSLHPSGSLILTSIVCAGSGSALKEMEPASSPADAVPAAAPSHHICCSHPTVGIFIFK